VKLPGRNDGVEARWVIGSDSNFEERLNTMTTATLPAHGHKPQPGGVDSGYAWFRMFVCVVLGTVGNVGMWAVVVVIPAVQTEFGVDRADASMPYTATLIGFALGNVFMGRIVDRLGVVLPIIAAGFALGAGFILAALTADIWQFTIIQGVVIGLATATTFGPMLADLSHWFEKRRGIAIATAASGNYLAGAIWPMALDGVLQAEGWRIVYLIIGLICMTTIVPMALLLRRPLPQDTSWGALKGTANRFGTLDMAPRTLQTLLIIAGVACCVAMSMPQVHMVAYCADLGFGVTHGTQMLALMLMGGVVSRLISGVIADYIGGIKTLILGSVLQTLALVLYLPFDGLMSLYVVSLLFGLSQGGIVPSYALIVREYMPAHEAGQRVGLVIMATLGGMALGGWLSGWIYDLTGSYQAAFLNGIAWNVLNIGIMLIILMHVRRPQKQERAPHYASQPA
jgi:MFS family permease